MKAAHRAAFLVTKSMSRNSFTARLRRVCFRNYRRLESVFSSRNRVSYGTVRADGLLFRYNRKDVYIPMLMYGSGDVYSKEDILFFFDMARKHYGIIPSASDIFLDIGANIGTTSIYINKVICPGIRTIAFEPESDNFRTLEENARLNGCSNFEAVNLALSDCSSHKTLMINETNRGGSSLEAGNEGGTTQTVSTVPLADFLSSRSIRAESIGFIWLDTEGHEPQVIEGAMEVLKKKRIPLFMEFNPSKYTANGKFDQLLGNLSQVYSTFYSTDGTTGKIEDLKTLYLQGKVGFNDIFLV